MAPQTDTIPDDVEQELRRIIGALCYEVTREIADDVYLRVQGLIRQAMRSVVPPTGGGAQEREEPTP